MIMELPAYRCAHPAAIMQRRLAMAERLGGAIGAPVRGLLKTEEPGALVRDTGVLPVSGEGPADWAGHFPNHLTASLPPLPADIEPLGNGVTTQVTGGKDSQRFFALDVPSGASDLEFDVPSIQDRVSPVR